jgi:hypothetical protein
MIINSALKKRREEWERLKQVVEDSTPGRKRSLAREELLKVYEQQRGY